MTWNMANWKNSPTRNSQCVMDDWKKTRNHGGRKKYLIQQFVTVLKILFEKDQDLEDQLFKRRLLMSFGNYFLLLKCLNYVLKRPTCFQRHERECYTQKSKARDTDNVKMKAFLGLLLLAGTYHSNRMNLDNLWKADGNGFDVFRLTMSLHCFRFLLCCIRFDDKATRASRKLLDKLVPIRDLFETFVQNCLRNYLPSEFVMIDEMLVAFTGRCPFRHYVPNKPAKYGIKIQAMADAKTYYTCEMEVYAGK